MMSVCLDQYFNFEVMICFPNAKINIGLRVLEKRADGYHNIESLIYPITLFDALEFLPAEKFSLKIHGRELPVDDENIITRTWKTFSSQFPIRPVKIELYKAIPFGAGLGGGSSDAAFFAKALNKHFGLGLTSLKLRELLLPVGSDCPFFVENKSSIITGRGEKIEPANISLKGLVLVLIFPDIEVSTKVAFSKIKQQSIMGLIKNTIKKPINTWQNEMVNDFEKPIFKIYPQLENIKNELYQSGAVYASMTGSGSAIYGIFKQKPILSSALLKYNYWAEIIPE